MRWIVGLAAVVATGNQQAHERSLGLISVAPAQERPRASLAEEARRGASQATRHRPVASAADKRSGRIARRRPAAIIPHAAHYNRRGEGARERAEGEGNDAHANDARAISARAVRYVR